MHILNVFECQTIKTSKTLKNLLRTNNEVLFFPVFALIKYVLEINLVNLSSLT